jgi:hypothetical protein
VRLGKNSSALLECLHLEALGVRVSLRVWLVTLGGYRHLDEACYSWWLPPPRQLEQ